MLLKQSLYCLYWKIKGNFNIDLHVSTNKSNHTVVGRMLFSKVSPYSSVHLVQWSTRFPDFLDLKPLLHLFILWPIMLIVRLSRIQWLECSLTSAHVTVYGRFPLNLSSDSHSYRHTEVWFFRTCHHFSHPLTLGSQIVVLVCCIISMYQPYLTCHSVITIQNTAKIIWAQMRDGSVYIRHIFQFRQHHFWHKLKLTLLSLLYLVYSHTICRTWVPEAQLV